MKRRQLRLRKVGVESQIFAQLWHAEKLRAHISATESIRGFGPARNRQGRQEFFMSDISGRIVLHSFRQFEVPHSCSRVMLCGVRKIIFHDVIVLILLNHLHALELITVWLKVRDEPGAIIRSIPKNLSADPYLFWSSAIEVVEKYFAAQLRVWSERVIQRQDQPRRKKSKDHQGKEHARNADACGEHRYDLVRARHFPEAKEQSQ